MRKPAKTKIHVKKGDLVKVIAGDDRGKIGKVLKTIRKKQKIVVEKVNLRTKHIQRTQKTDADQIIKFEAPFHSSNVMLYSSNKKVASRYKKMVDKNNKKHRILKKTKEAIS